MVGGVYAVKVSLSFDDRTKIQCFGSGYSAEFLGTTELKLSGPDTCTLQAGDFKGVFQVQGADTVSCNKAGTAIVCD